MLTANRLAIEQFRRANVEYLPDADLDAFASRLEGLVVATLVDLAENAQNATVTPSQLVEDYLEEIQALVLAACICRLEQAARRSQGR